MEVIILGFSVILLAVYGSRAFMMHRGYNDQLYARLFSSYLEYFYRNAIRHDCSISSLLKTKIGTHRLSFTTIQNNQGEVTSRFVLIFYNKGIACISYLNLQGEISGKPNDKYWMILRDQKKYKLVNPLIECKKYGDRLRKKCPTMHVQEYIACSDNTILHTQGSVYLYKDIIDTIKAVNIPYIAEETILSEYRKLSDQKG